MVVVPSACPLASLTLILTHFDLPIRLSKVMGGALKANQMEGTLWWSGVTDAGLEIAIPLQQLIYVPHGDTRIFNPQHWAHNMLKLHPKCQADSCMCGRKEHMISLKLDDVLHTIIMPNAHTTMLVGWLVNSPPEQWP